MPLPYRLTRLGFRHEFIHAVRNAAGMRAAHGFSAEQIAGVLTELMR